MNCAELERWLDQESPDAGERGAREHAAGCASCSALLRAHESIERLLTHENSGTLADHARFVDRVMLRVASAERQAARIDLWPAMTPLPWWIQAAADPGVFIASAFAALLLWRPDWLTHVTRLASEGWSLLLAWPALAQARVALGMDRPLVMLGFLLLGIFALGWISIQLYRWTERIARRSAGV